jgi:hypothetical protein
MISASSLPFRDNGMYHKFGRRAKPMVRGSFRVEAEQHATLSALGIWTPVEWGPGDPPEPQFSFSLGVERLMTLIPPTVLAEAIAKERAPYERRKRLKIAFNERKAKRALKEDRKYWDEYLDHKEMARLNALNQERKP